MTPGTQGYAEQAGDLLVRYEEVPFEVKHRAVLPLLPQAASRILDVGAGTGADAAWFAGRGHHVVAVEPTHEMRVPGMALHPSPAIEWVDDALPALATVIARGRAFDVLMLSAVWMHLDVSARRVAMTNLASLLAPDGVLLLSLRHGAVPEGRRMFAVTGAETIALAQRFGLVAVLDVTAESSHPLNRAAGITWTQLAFKRARGAGREGREHA